MLVVHVAERKAGPGSGTSAPGSDPLPSSQLSAGMCFVNKSQAVSQFSVCVLQVQRPSFFAATSAGIRPSGPRRVPW